MRIRINGDKVIRNADVTMSSDGRVMTVKAVNPSISVAEIAALLGGEPRIEVLEDIGLEVKAVYQGAKMTTVNMELSNGRPIVTVSLLVSRMSAADAEELRRQIDAQNTSIASLRQTVENQTFVIAAQEAAIKLMGENVSAAQTAAQNAENAIKAIEEGIADA